MSTAGQEMVSTARRPVAGAPTAATRREIRLVMAGAMLALTLASLDGNIVGPALPRIVSDLGGLAHISWVVTAFSVASTASTPLYGKLSDQFGRKPAFFLSIGIFVLGSALCGLSHSMGQLIGFRALQGVGAGGLMALAQTTMADVVPPAERPRYQAWITSVFAVCSVAGPLLGGVITDTLSWPWIFYINLPVGAAAMAILSVALKPRPRTAGRAIDAAGFALIITATCTGLLALTWGGGVYPWVSPQVLGLAAISFVCIAILIPVERRAPEAALPPRLFADGLFVCGVASISLAVMSLFAALVFVPLYFQLVHGASASEAGLRTAPVMAGIIGSSIVGGRLVAATGRYKLYPVIGLALATTAYASMAWAVGAGVGANGFDGLLVLLGAGTGLVMPNITTAIQNGVAPRDLGVATATAAFFRSLGGAFGVALAGSLLSSTLRARLPLRGGRSLLEAGLQNLQSLPPDQHRQVTDAYAHALSLTFAASSVIAALALGLAVFLPERPLRRSVQ